MGKEFGLKIYTGFGDAGKTSLFGGQVVDKDDLRVEAYGTVDELNSILGLVIAELEDTDLSRDLRDIQQNLFRLSTELATPVRNNKRINHQTITSKDINKIENGIDELDSLLVPLKNFILPGGSHRAALLHLARTVCRRAERRLISLNKTADVDSQIMIYVNRLSDYFFVLARYVNLKDKIKDILWIDKKKHKV
jgi:cob(I)alamin adenosyltransferase